VISTDRLDPLVQVAGELSRAGSAAEAVSIAVARGIAAVGGHAGGFSDPRAGEEVPTVAATGAPIVQVAVRRRETMPAVLWADLPPEHGALQLFELLAELLAAALERESGAGASGERRGQSGVRPRAVLVRGGADPIEALTARERVVFRLVVDGLSNEGIARELKISVKTVQTHRANINEKLGVHCTGQLVRFAALRGLIAS
jgi:DNA-binding CsgD family transcriptional regulator